MSAAIVSRGTLRTVRPLLFRKYLQEANAAGLKDTTRRVLTANNCVLSTGEFDALDLETGRAKVHAPQAELRAQCTFESGRVRVVSVLSKVRAGDLFWVKTGRFGARLESEQTLEVTKVRVARVQDMTAEDFRREGVEALPPKFDRRGPGARERFAMLWDDINGDEDHSWARNPWVWVYEYRVHMENIDRFIGQ